MDYMDGIIKDPF